MSLAELRLLDPTVWTAGYVVEVAGYAASNDGGGGSFSYDPTSTEADNDGTVVSPANGIGRWFRVFSTPVNVRWFGAQGDGVTNDTAAIANAISAYDHIYFPQGTYVTDTIVFPLYPRTVNLYGDGPNATILTPLNANSAIFAGPGSVVPSFGTARNTVKSFGLKAHASGSAGPAVDMRNMSWHIFQEITFFDNGTGVFAQGFFLSDASAHCYSNTLRFIRAYGQKGPTTLVRVEGTAYLQYFEHFHASYDLSATGIKVFDFASGLYAMFVKDCHFEGITGTAIIPGIFTSIENCYFENVVSIDGTGRENHKVFVLACNFGVSASPVSTSRYLYIGCVNGEPGTIIRRDNSQNNIFTLETDNGFKAELVLGQSGNIAWHIFNEATTGILKINDGGADRMEFDKVGGGVRVKHSAAMEFGVEAPNGFQSSIALSQPGIRVWRMVHTATTSLLKFNEGGLDVLTLHPDGKIGVPLIAGATVLGAVVNRWPIYDQFGVLKGYIPIYDNIA